VSLSPICARLDLGVRVTVVSVLTELGLGFRESPPSSCCKPENPDLFTRSADTIDRTLAGSTSNRTYGNSGYKNNIDSDTYMHIL